MFRGIKAAPPDAILGLSEAFGKDSNPNKINLTVGVYKDATGKTPILTAVKKAEERVFASEETKNYLGIDGAQPYTAAVRNLLFGPGHDIIEREVATTVHTPGGTGALRVAADFLASLDPKPVVWLSDPTWANHPSIFKAAGLTVESYAYYDPASGALDVEACINALRGVPEGDVVVFHGCCHNPTGMDPSAEEWQRIAKVAAERKFLPFIDFAYQGFATDLWEDATGLKAICDHCSELLVASSFSKNFGLYRERVGALTLVAEAKEGAIAALSRLKKVIRCNYSNPPSHGAAIVQTVLDDPALRSEWEAELSQMRERINGIRKRFVEAMAEEGVSQDFSFVGRQKGMFSLSGLSAEQVTALREEHSVYLVGDGRLNVAGITEENVGSLCRAIKAVL